jgi:hypothetical protein
MITNKTQNQLLTPLATEELIPLLDTTDNASTMAWLRHLSPPARRHERLASLGGDRRLGPSKCLGH